MIPEINKCQRQLYALARGLFDDAELLELGALESDRAATALRIIQRVPTSALTQQLQTMGFVVGQRDPRLNTLYSGEFMVAEEHDESELPTEDGRNGPWCIVGDDLHCLCVEAYQVWAEPDERVFGSQQKQEK